MEEKATDRVLMSEPEVVQIPAGPFLMGTSEAQINLLARLDERARRWREKGRFDREGPQHTVILATYAIGRYPVTVGEFQRFVEGDGYQSERFWTPSGWAWRQESRRMAPDLWDDAVWASDERLPVVGVTWYEADAYGRWLSAMTGRVYRLPTEAEWEKAARGTGARIFPWGDELDPARCNTREGGLGRTTQVDGMPAGASPYGCLEMGGNASEWTLSKLWPYPYDVQDGREDPEGEEERVIRGGSWFKPLLRARVSARGMNDPHFGDNDVGLRIVLEEQEE
jgi:formylglycine-generating enzyme required for sulfatase activity